jgi:hypothetical protein
MNKKVIRTTITLVGDTLADGSNQIITEELRTICTINFGNGSVVPTAEVIIYGLNMPAMLKLMRIRWRDIRSMQNTIKVEAGEQGKELVTVYEGNITFGYVDMSNAPDVAFRITSSTAILDMYTASSPVTFKGVTPVAQALGVIAEKMGYELENNGVPDSLTMKDVTLTDTDLNKIRTLCKRYQIDLYIEQKRISIAPQGAPRNIRIATLRPGSGLIGYPAPTMQGVDVRCLYSPAIRFGGVIRIADSIMATCNGDWRVFGVTLNLESEVPGGNWFMDIRATHNEPNNAAISR